MSNQTLLALIFVVVCAIGALFMINMGPTIFNAVSDLTIPPSHVRGSAIQRNQVLYTLNYNQQNAVIEIINHAIPLKEGGAKKSKTPPGFEKLIIYRFNAPNIEIIPSGFVGDNLEFSAPQLRQNGYFLEVSAGVLQDLLPQIYE